LNFTVRASDGTVASSATLTINVEDDSPAVAQAQAQATTVIDSNLMVILDLSSSMTETDGVGGSTRFASAISSIKTLLDKYDTLGDVAVRLVTFGTNAQAVGTVWTTVAQARALLDAIPPPPLPDSPNVQFTNYDEALADAISAFGSSGKLTTGQNVSYFISDGVPTAGTGGVNLLAPAGQSPGTPPVTGTFINNNATDDGIQAAEETLWKNFLIANDVNSYALGVGGAAQGPLNPIAYNGKAETDSNGILVTAFSQLDAVLGATVPAPVSGNLLAGSLLPAGGIGADGGAYIKSITVNGITYTYIPATGAGSIVVTGGTGTYTFDSATLKLTVTSKQPDLSTGGKFIVDMDDGDYRYEVPPSVAGASLTESMGFVVNDRDGDTTGETLTLTVTKPTFTNGSATANTLTGGDGVDIITGGAGNDTISGGQSNDELYGNAGNDNLSGGDGNDIISGGDGNDIISGGDGNDKILGDFGSDQITGGAGSDVFKWSLADTAATNAAKAIDTITDFNSSAASAGGDVLDLRDLLTGETTATIANFLDISVASGNTTIKISPAGGFTGGNVNNTETHDIVLQGVDIRAGLGLAGTATEAQIITKLIADGKLLIDN
jgi:Ca2+-binding RTX toxin-like protein